MLSMFVVWLTLLPSWTLPVHDLMPSVEAHRHFHIRILDRGLDDLIDQAIVRSPTFASLVARLETTDIIVHIDRVVTLPRALRARLALTGATGDVRYLRVEIRANLATNDTLATLAHELQHAVEIGDAREVRSDVDVCALYHRIGEEREWMRFESQEADAVGRQVEMELIEPRQD